MKTLKYTNSNLDFTKELRSKVKAYFKENEISQYGNRKIIYKTIVMAAVYLVPYFLMASGTLASWYAVILSYFIMGLGMSGLGMATMHDANHGSFSKSMKVNRLFSKSLYLLGGYPPNWQFQHNTLHHGYTNVEGHDEDIAPIGVLRFSPHHPHKAIHKYQHLYAWFFYSLMTVSWITAKDFKRLNNYHKMDAVLSSNKSIKRLYFDLIVTKLFYYGFILAIPLFMAPVAWYWVVAGFILMHFTSGLILSTIFQTAHVVPTSEYPLPSDEDQLEHNWTVHQLYTTSDFAPTSKLFSWCIGGLNFQVIHHLFPNISHVHYKNLSLIVKEVTQKYGLPYYVNPTFRAAVLEHVRMLKKLGRTNNAKAFVPNPAAHKGVVTV